MNRDRDWCDALIALGQIDRPEKYCRMGKCERAELGGEPCECWKRYASECTTQDSNGN